MQVEGVGRVSPKPLRQRVDPMVVRHCAQWAQECASARGWGKSSDRWKKGTSAATVLLGDARCCSWFSGLAIAKVAEWYVAERFGERPDMQIKPTGDSGVDLDPSWLPCGPVQVKTSTYPCDLLVKQGSKELEVCDWFVATKWNGQEEFLYMLGWASKAQVLSAPLTRGIGGWMNHGLSINSLYPMSGILSLQRISKVL